MKLSTSFMTETFINAVKALPLTLSLALVPFLAGSVFWRLHRSDRCASGENLHPFTFL